MNQWNLIPRCFIFILPVLLNACALNGSTADGPPQANINIDNVPNAIPRHLPKSRYGNPTSYVVNGKRYYVLSSAKNYNQTGIASWYGSKFHGRLTSTRQPYNMYAMTAASPTLPIPCFVRVTDLANHHQIIVKVNDRGPFAANRIIDLSYVAAKKLGFMQKGTAWVRVSSIDIESPYMPKDPHLYLQLGAYSQDYNAKKTLNHAQKITSIPVKISRTDKYLETLYKVEVGPINSTRKADQLQHTFILAGFTSAFTIIK